MCSSGHFCVNHVSRYKTSNCCTSRMFSDSFSFCGFKIRRVTRVYYIIQKNVDVGVVQIQRGRHVSKHITETWRSEAFIRVTSDQSGRSVPPCVLLVCWYRKDSLHGRQLYEALRLIHNVQRVGESDRVSTLFRRYTLRRTGDIACCYRSLARDTRASPALRANVGN